MDDNYHKILDDRVSEYHDLYSLSNTIKHYKTTYLNRTVYYSNKYYWGHFENNLKVQMEYLSSYIKKHLISCEEHYEKLRQIHKDIKCGLNRYLFQTKYRGNRKNVNIFNNKIFPKYIESHIISFLDTRDNLALKFASVYTNKEIVKSILSSMTISTIKQFPYIYTRQTNYCENMDICKRTMNKLLKSYTKNKSIELLVDNFDHLYVNFRNYDITPEYINSIHHCNVNIDNESPYHRICGEDKYSIYFDPYYIPKAYMVYFLKLLCGINIYNKIKLKNKNRKD